MDDILGLADEYVLTPYVYPVTWKEDDVMRQTLSLFAIVNIGAYMLYLITASLTYMFLFDKRLMKHPHFLKDQIKLEILYACKAIPFVVIPTVALFVLEVRGYSQLYDSIHDTKLGYFGVFGSVVTFILFTDCLIYWIHRFLHHRYIYKHVHKYHHKWKVPSPFASHSLHPVDSFLQGCPYHIYVFLFPIHKYTYLGLFVFVIIWAVTVHDGDYRVPDLLKPFVNGSAHHMDHHNLYNCNYGQFFTLWDRIGNTFRNPSSFEGKGPIKTIKELEEKLARQQSGRAKRLHSKGE